MNSTIFENYRQKTVFHSEKKKLFVAPIVLITFTIILVVCIFSSFVFFFPITSMLALIIGLLSFKFLVKRKHLTFFEDVYDEVSFEERYRNLNEN